MIMVNLGDYIERTAPAVLTCEGTWRNYPLAPTYPGSDTYRQHRCGRDGYHRGPCTCRYCGRSGNA